MSEIKEFICVGCGEIIDEIRFIDIFYIEVQDEKYQYRICFDREVFKAYSQFLPKFPFTAKLNLQNYKILQKISIHDAKERDLRNIAKAKELELRRQILSGSLKGGKNEYIQTKN